MLGIHINVWMLDIYINRFISQLPILHPNIDKPKSRYISDLFVSMQTTLTADEVILHKICANYDIEAILGRFGPKSAKYRFYIINCTDFMQNQLISC